MRFSLLLAGAAGASALSIPDATAIAKKATDQITQMANGFVDLSVFPKMPLGNPAEAISNAGKDKIWNPAEVPAPPGAAPNAPGGSRLLATSSAQATCTNPRVRYEWRKLTDQHKADYVKAAKCVFSKPGTNAMAGYPGASKNLHMWMAATHQRQTPNVHGTGYFLPFHRYYMYVYERIMREDCGYTGPMAWWDETKDAGRFQYAPPFTQAHFGNGVPKRADGSGTCITSGAFGSTQLSVGPGTSRSGNNYCLSRAVDNQLSQQVNSNYVNSCNSHNNFTEMTNCQYLGPHAYGHNSVGAVMTDMYASPGDPIFFLHHGFVDRNWRIWQNANKNGRLYQINGRKCQSGGGCGNVGLDDTLGSDGIRPAVKVRDMMDTLGGFLCYKYDY